MECYCPKCELRLALGQPHKCAPAQEEKEMERNDKGQMICDHCKEPITLTGTGETWVNTDPKAYHRKCFHKAVTEPAERAAELRERWDRAFFAALTGYCAKPIHTWPDGSWDDSSPVTRAADVADETIRRHADMIAARDVVIAEVVG